MRSLLLCVSVLFLAVLVSPGLAQTTVPNGGFENWTNANPDGWYSNNLPGIASPVTKSTTARSGSGSLRGEVVSMSIVAPTPYAPVVQSGVGAAGFPWNQRSATFSGYYQFSPVAGRGDRFSINAVLWKGTVGGGTGIASAATIASSAASSWTQFSLPFIYVTNDVPDNCYIQIMLIGATTSAPPAIGSYYLIDDLSLSGTAGPTAVDDPSRSIPSGFALEQNYPNPFNPSTNIRFSVAQTGHVSLKVYSVLGAEVASLVNEQKEIGTFNVNWNAAEFPSGIYLYRLSVTSEKGQVFEQSKKLVLLK